MSSDSVLEAEELENVPLVRMADVQPDRSVEYAAKSDEVYETCIVDSDFECVVNDEDSNIGSMVSIKSEDVIYEDAELIVPEVLEESVLEEVEDEELGSQLKLISGVVTQIKAQKQTTPDSTAPPAVESTNPVVELTNVSKNPESWPTLEILPGGVINLAEKMESQETLVHQDLTETANEMMYVCAKCSQSFKFLFCLVKHVRWHEVEARRLKMQALIKMTPIEKKMAELARRSSEIDKTFRRHKGIAEAPVATKKSSKGNYICLHSKMRKIVTKPKVKKIPKKS